MTPLASQPPRKHDIFASLWAAPALGLLVGILTADALLVPLAMLPSAKVGGAARVMILFSPLGFLYALGCYVFVPLYGLAVYKVVDRFYRHTRLAYCTAGVALPLLIWLLLLASWFDYEDALWIALGGPYAVLCGFFIGLFFFELMRPLEAPEPRADETSATPGKGRPTRPGIGKAFLAAPWAGLACGILLSGSLAFAYHDLGHGNVRDAMFAPVLMLVLSFPALPYAVLLMSPLIYALMLVYGYPVYVLAGRYFQHALHVYALAGALCPILLAVVTAALIGDPESGEKVLAAGLFGVPSGFFTGVFFRKFMAAPSTERTYRSP